MLGHCVISNIIVETITAKFFFNATCSGKPLKKSYVEYIENVPNNFGNIFSSCDVKNKTIEINGRIIIPDPKMCIVREGEAQNPSSFRYYIFMFGKKFIKVDADKDDPIIIKVEPISKQMLINSISH